ncbi:MAG: MlaE family lipid ABC transporter permease subunit [Gammaproteobacteria bacterium]|nr:MlaE family lipid ABC transporter permease subunit [Gammaproteobacteria bacterium]HJP37164.1 MlaE family lipid ABC transporter permease subunit [Gammaproteobacteria bacterium]
MISAIRTPIVSLGGNIIAAVEELGRMGIFFATVLRHAVWPPWEFRLILRQLRFVGARSTLVIAVAGAFVGMVVALQFYDTLVRFGSVSLLGSAVGLSLVRELGPVLTALIIIGRAGSATCAEIGIMRSDNQIDALECMAIDPYRYLIVPRFLAFLIAIPLLTGIFDVIGILGGWFVGVVVFEVNQGAYFQSMADSVLLHDLNMGITKSVAFSMVIVWVSTGKGFLMHLNRSMVFGAEGVSRVTTDAVVVASISVLFADYIISALML